jgi:hypothetical protein
VRQVAGLQLHGTGTSLGDPIEVGAAAGEQPTGCRGLPYKHGGCLHMCVPTQPCLPCPRAPAGLLLDGRTAALSLLASKSTLGHSEPASGIMGLANLYQVLYCLLHLLYCVCTAAQLWTAPAYTSGGASFRESMGVHLPQSPTPTRRP